MKTRLGLGILFAALLATSVGYQPVERVQAQDKPAQKHAKGRIAPSPEKLAAMHAQALKRHGLISKKIPKVTARQWDCRSLGYVPPAKNQRSCGSCWDFSGTFVVEGAFLKAGGYGKPDGSFALSEQYTLDCGRNGGCNGDDNTTVLDWAKKTGLPLTLDYGPYTASAGRCKSSSSMKMFKIQDWGFCTQGGGQNVSDTQDIKNSMVAFGPIGCAVAAGGSNFWNTGQGTCTGRSTGIDHDVGLIGWDDDHDNGDGSKGAWIMHNSWGTEWGTEGNAWMKYGSDSIGTEAVWATATSLLVTPIITSPITASGVVGAPFTYQIVASNSPTMYGATGLADGLSCNVTTGFISGAPTAEGTSAFTVDATNAAGKGSETVQLTVTDAVPPPVPPTPPPLPGAPVITSVLSLKQDIGSDVSYQITATNNPEILDALNLPAAGGWKCSPGGLITGSYKGGVSRITLLAANRVGASTAILTITSNAKEATITLTPEQVQSVIDQQSGKSALDARQGSKSASQPYETPCPECGSVMEVRSTRLNVWLQCPKCGHRESLTEPKKATPSKKLTPQPYELACPECGASMLTQSNADGSRYLQCPKCGHKEPLTEPTKKANPSKRKSLLKKKKQRDPFQESR